MERPNFKVIGKPIPRYDALDKVTGKLKYLKDYQFTGMLYGKILRSPYPFAKILSIDTSAAEAYPGVRAVITSKDTAMKLFSFQQEFADKYMLAKDIVRYAGDEVAAVAADSLLIAERAVSLIKVEYQPMEGVFDPESALKQGAPIVHADHGKTSNIAFEVHREFGDVDKAFSECDFTMEHRYTTTQVFHSCLETNGCVAQWDLASNHVTMWGPFQAPHTGRQEIARLLDLPTGNITLHRTMNGGGFGQKVVIDILFPISALLSKKCNGRPVQLVNNREEEFMSSRGRYPYIIDLKTGYNKNGKIVAQQGHVIMDNGAYCDKGVAIANFSGRLFCTLYRVPNLKWDVYGAYTNHQYNTAFRGFGWPQTNFAFESQMDKIAKHLGMDPAEIRLKNPTYAGDSTEAGAYFGSCSMVECVEEAVKKGRWHEKRAESGRHGNKLRGTGLSTLVFTGSGGRYYSYASCDSFIKIAEDGLVSIITNSCELGQGIQTVVMQIVMEVLGVKAERIRIIDDNTDTVPYDLGAWGSRQTFVIGNSVKAAAENIKKDIIAAAARMLEKNDNLEIIDEKIYIDYGNNRYVETDLTYDQVINYCYYFLGTPLSSKGSHIDREARFTRGRKDFVKDIVTFTFACQMATVEIDIDTGKIEVVDFFATQETGTTINPLTCSGQIDGAIVQGIGMTLYERVYRENGIQKTLGYVDYKVPTALDVPTIDNEFIENYDDPFGPFGAKGIGESSLCPTPAAINNAIYDATGLEFNGLPILPEDVLRALKEKGIK